VTYADDLVMLCKKGNADEALQQLRKIMTKLKLTVNEEKTRICKVPEGEFDFLGCTFGRMRIGHSTAQRCGCAGGCSSSTKPVPGGDQGGTGVVAAHREGARGSWVRLQAVFSQPRRVAVASNQKYRKQPHAK
jgi:hypothetical protein